MNPSPPLLNEDQHRALSARLALLDRQLAEAEIFLSGTYPEGEMFEIARDIPAARAEDLPGLSGQAREGIKKRREQCCQIG